jgi:alpha-beta hydrolase superfamily lysophospholipase
VGKFGELNRLAMPAGPSLASVSASTMPALGSGSVTLGLWDRRARRWKTQDDERPASLFGECFLLHTRSGPVAVYRASPAGGTELPPVLLIHGVGVATSAFEVAPLYEHLQMYRAVYAMELPGFGRSSRVARDHTPDLMVEAIIDVAEAIRDLHRGVALDAVAQTLSCEFLARAALESPLSFRSLALVSPTGMGKRPDSQAGLLKAKWAKATQALWSQLLGIEMLAGTLFGLLSHPRMVRRALAQAWGTSLIDPDLLDHAVLACQGPEAHRAPVSYLSGKLFSQDAYRQYAALTLPVWLAHGVRGGSLAYHGKARLMAAPNWKSQVFPSGAYPHFEVRRDFCSAYDRYLGWTALFEPMP